MADYEDMTDEELCRLLWEKVPYLASVVDEVRDSNRETVIAFLRLLSDGGH